MLIGSPVWRKSKVIWLAVCVQSLALSETYTRGAWAGMFISALLIVMIFRLYRRRWFWALVAVLGLLLVGGVKAKVLPGSLVGRLRTLKSPGDDPAMIPRYARWESFSNRSLERPWPGATSSSGTNRPSPAWLGR